MICRAAPQYSSAGTTGPGGAGTALFARTTFSPGDTIGIGAPGTPTYFATKYTVPAGVSVGDLFSIGFGILFNGVPAVASSNYGVGVRIGGAGGAVAYIAPAGSLVATNGTTTSFYFGLGGASGGFLSVGAAASVVAIGLLQRPSPAYAVTTGGFGASPFDSSSGFDVEVFVNFAIGADPLLTASLQIFQMEVTKSA